MINLYNKQLEVIKNQKEMAITFLNLVVSGKVKEAFETFISPKFFHHNPFFKGDSASLMMAMEEDSLINPNKVMEIKQVIAENDKVVILSHVKQTPDDLGWVTIHIFRFIEGKIIELWDLSQAIPSENINEFGVF